MNEHVRYRIGPNAKAKAGYDDFQRRLAVLLKQKRDGAPITVFAEEAYVNPGTWRKAESGDLDVHVSTLFKLCSMLNVHPVSLFE